MPPASYHPPGGAPLTCGPWAAPVTRVPPWLAGRWIGAATWGVCRAVPCRAVPMRVPMPLHCVLRAVLRAVLRCGVCVACTAVVRFSSRAHSGTLKNAHDINPVMIRRKSTQAKRTQRLQVVRITLCVCVCVLLREAAVCEESCSRHNHSASPVGTRALPWLPLSQRRRQPPVATRPPHTTASTKCHRTPPAPATPAVLLHTHTHAAPHHTTTA